AAPDVLAARPLRMEESDRRARIALAAYFRAEQRGFTPGGEMEDWLAAERELDSGPARVTPAASAAPVLPPADLAAVAAAVKPTGRAPRRGAARERRTT